MIFLKKYLLKQKFKHDVVNLFIHHFLRLTGTGLLGIFGIIYLYNIFYDVKFVFLFYILAYTLYAFGLPLGMKAVNFLSFKTSMMVAQLFLVFYYISLYFMGKAENVWLWFFISLIFFVLLIMFYWVPWHTDFAKLTNVKSRGKNLALLTGAITLMSVVSPFVSSIIISYLGYEWLFAVVIFLIVSSTFYLRKIAPINEHFSYSVKQAYQELFSRKNSKLFLAYFSDGAQDIIGGIVWPLFIFILLKGDYLSVGLITSLIVLVAVIIRLVVGDYADKFSKEKIIRFSSFFHSLGWVFKALVTTPLQIFAAGSYHSLTNSATRISFDSLMYEQAADNGHYADEYSVMRGMSLGMGRVFALSLGIIFAGTIGLQWLFLVAAFVSLFLGLL